MLKINGFETPTRKPHTSITQLYKQKQTAPKRAAMLDDYITRWLRWVVAGLDDKPIKIVFYIEQ
jgi:hypothetical protein